MTVLFGQNLASIDHSSRSITISCNGILSYKLDYSIEVGTSIAIVTVCCREDILWFNILCLSVSHQHKLPGTSFGMSVRHWHV